MQEISITLGKWIFLNWGQREMCLFNLSIAVMKEYNSKRQYETKHQQSTDSYLINILKAQKGLQSVFLLQMT